MCVHAFTAGIKIHQMDTRMYVRSFRVRPYLSPPIDV